MAKGIKSEVEVRFNSAVSMSQCSECVIVKWKCHGAVKIIV